ncbi:hypothetical protein [Pseudoalteromonas prydzensis]|uniref:hypothetical protein n=1 Tax=Pseudoalteromonas prydzensis TaxID=182141 RepID=UPI0007E510EC|nr:hypothetical protein [Pseudoalteromonas prydzensis]MBE0377213.1 hypothetical protein [Pseudoalteromonas prydzensis ACAM 620]
MAKILLISLSVLLAACSEPAPKSVGSDVDEYGCKASAGYEWCGKTQQCERPWELAKKHDFENTQSEFTAFCTIAE